jgi:hypothetical protein
MPFVASNFVVFPSISFLKLFFVILGNNFVIILEGCLLSNFVRILQGVLIRFAVLFNLIIIIFIYFFFFFFFFVKVNFL